MMKTARRMAGRIVLAGWIGVGSPALAAATPAAHEAESLESAAVETTGGGCAAETSCGIDCTAELLHGVCLAAISWQGRITLGPFQIGPALEGSCDLCECWYRYTNELGDSIFKRTTTLSCGASAPGVEVHVA